MYSVRVELRQTGNRPDCSPRGAWCQIIGQKQVLSSCAQLLFEKLYRNSSNLKATQNKPVTKIVNANIASNLKTYALALFVGGACVVFQVLDLAIPLRFGRTEILQSDQWWRILTGNLVHLGFPHLFLNLAGLALITLLLAHTLTLRQWVFTGLCSMLGVGIGLLLFDPQLSWYVGLSGALYGLLLGGAIAEFKNHKQMALLIAAFTIGKIIWEQIFGAVDSSEAITGGTVIVNAHLYGMVSGGLAVLFLLTIEFIQKKRG